MTDPRKQAFPPPAPDSPFIWIWKHAGGCAYTIESMGDKPELGHVDKYLLLRSLGEQENPAFRWPGLSHWLGRRWSSRET